MKPTRAFRFGGPFYFYGLMECPADILDHAKKGYHAGRYTCVNLLNDSTMEMKALSWTTFAAGCQQPELVQYLKERRLYINEPVESEVEV